MRTVPPTFDDRNVAVFLTTVPIDGDELGPLNNPQQFLVLGRYVSIKVQEPGEEFAFIGIIQIANRFLAMGFVVRRGQWQGLIHRGYCTNLSISRVEYL
jgi:hypothetical protein